MEAQLSRSFSPQSAKRKVMQPGRRNFCAVVLFAVATAFFIVAPASAHAVLLESTPPLNGSVSGPNVVVKLRFNVRIDAIRSRLTLLRPDGSAQALEISKKTPAHTLSPEPPAFPPGPYPLPRQFLPPYA